MKEITLVLPWAPSVNHAWGKSGKRIYRSTKYRAFINNVRAIVLSEFPIPLQDGPLFPADKRVSVTIDEYKPNKRKIDIDNRAKTTLDALTLAGVWYDDEQVDELHLYKREPIKNGSLIVSVSTIERV